MTKEEYHRLQGKLDAGGLATNEEALSLAGFCEGLICVIENAAEEIDGDLFGTEGWEHAIGWD